ncbi:hypothetical protein [Pseudonocardia alni]|uniref:Uncharacterized protein n=1 Tax=Pseudonocardia alni TaxID=33907 RepID=A0A852W499_PSEA5|nr:hypothetical protein [Pseudonocardia antarctica]NYG03948.1 hypothetical protein [Pseudonocardia antarctica]
MVGTGRRSAEMMASTREHGAELALALALALAPSSAAGDVVTGSSCRCRGMGDLITG